MVCHTYKVVPFVGKIEGGQTAEDVSKQIQAIIDEMEKDEWEFYQLVTANVEIKLGFLSKLFGSGLAYASTDQLIFMKEV